MKRYKQRGFSIVSAIFLVVVLALIAGFLVTIGTVQQSSSAFSMVASRGHFAALSGIEWGVHEVLSNPAAPACLGAGVSFTVGGTGSGNFNVSVLCRAQTVIEGVRPAYSVFDIDVTAEFGASGSEDYFRRQLSAAVSSEL